MMKRTLAFLLLLVSAFVCGTVRDLAAKPREFRGRIAAYRPADRIQVGSFTPNKELFIFQPAETSGLLLKLTYEHQGYSDLPENVISGGTAVSVFADRDQSCDQSLGSFESGAHAVPIEGGVPASMEAIIFAAGVPRLPKSYSLKCYVLRRWSPIGGVRK